MREINSEPSTKGATDKTIIIVGFSRWQAMMACSVDEQHTMRAAAELRMAAMRLAVELHSEYMMIVWWFIFGKFAARGRSKNVPNAK